MIEVVEMYKTVQGEGTRIGAIANLIRLPSCNLNCKWCDTQNKEIVDPNLNEEALIDFLDKNPVSDVIITGGEPLNKMENLEQVLYTVNNNTASDIHITIETNGTIMPSEAVFDMMGETNLWSVSPKMPSSGQYYDLTIIQEINDRTPYIQLKFVIQDSLDIERAFEALGNLDEYYGPVIFQPCVERGMDSRVTYMERLAKLTNQIMIRLDQIPNKDQYRNIRVLPQLHKFVWGMKCEGV